ARRFERASGEQLARCVDIFGSGVLLDRAAFGVAVDHPPHVASDLYASSAVGHSARVGFRRSRRLYASYCFLGSRHVSSLTWFTYRISTRASALPAITSVSTLPALTWRASPPARSAVGRYRRAARAG